MKTLSFSLAKFVGFHHKTVILLLWTSQILRPISGLVCYSCTSSLDSTIEQSAQIALRIFLDSTYKLPPANRLCNMEDDVEFKTVPTAQCSITNDACIKVSAKNQGLDFIIRGCKTLLYRDNVQAQQKLPCVTNDGPSVCFCNESLCNTAVHRAHLHMFRLVLMLILLVIFTFIGGHLYIL